MECLFCSINKKTIPATIIYETSELIAINDINPQAPHHVLIIPKQHIATINDLTTAEKNLVGELFLAVKDIAKQLVIADEGYRTVFNCNANGGQEVYHIHLHLLGGRRMAWPPG